MIRSPKAVAHPIIAAALALILAIFYASPAQAQAANPSYVSIHTSQASVPEGGLAAFVLLRSGGDLARSLTVQVRSWEPNHVDAFGVNDTEQFHDVTFALGDNVATLNVVAVQDQRYDPPQIPPLILNAHTLNAEVVESADDSYHLGNPGAASLDIVDVNAPPFPQSQIYIQSSDTNLEITEGNDAVLTLTRTGDTTQPLAVDILVDDSDGHLRGNHWEPPPQHPAQIEFRANQSTRKLRLPVPDDQRDRPDGSFKVYVLPSFDYLISHTLLGQGATLSRTALVTDNDTAQELELNFGKDGVNDANVGEGNTLGFIVKRRQQDAAGGTTATFTVRLETDRGGDDHLLSDWTEDTATGRVYRDYPLRLTGSDQEVEEEFTVPENGEAEARWTYWASIRTLEDHEGAAVTTTGRPSTGR